MSVHGRVYSRLSAGRAVGLMHARKSCLRRASAGYPERTAPPRPAKGKGNLILHVILRLLYS